MSSVLTNEVDTINPVLANGRDPVWRRSVESDLGFHRPILIRLVSHFPLRRGRLAGFFPLRRGKGGTRSFLVEIGLRSVDRARNVAASIATASLGEGGSRLLRARVLSDPGTSGVHI